jgi:hypothetical protein
VTTGLIDIGDKGNCLHFLHSLHYLPPVSTIQALLVAKFATSVADTGGNLPQE